MAAQQSSPTLQGVLRLVRTLIAPDGGECELDDKKLCNLLYIEDLKYRPMGGIRIGLLALLAAARHLETMAMSLSAAGSIKTVAFTYNGSNGAKALMDIAARWRSEVEVCLAAENPVVASVQIAKPKAQTFWRDTFNRCCQRELPETCNPVLALNSNVIDYECCLDDC